MGATAAAGAAGTGAGRAGAALAPRAGLAAVVFTLLLCGAIMGQESGGSTSGRSGRSIGEVITGHTAELLAIPGVVGIAEGRCDGAPCIRVFVERRTEEIARSLPASLEGFPVAVEVTGAFRPLGKAEGS